MVSAALSEDEIVTLTAFRVSTLAASILDVHVNRKQTSRGVYRLQEVGDKQGAPAREPFFAGQGYGSGGLAAPRESAIWEEPRRSTGPYSEQADKLEQEQEYEAPPFGRDTGYHGA